MINNASLREKKKKKKVVFGLCDYLSHWPLYICLFEMKLKPSSEQLVIGLCAGSAGNYWKAKMPVIALLANGTWVWAIHCPDSSSKMKLNKIYRGLSVNMENKKKPSLKH